MLKQRTHRGRGAIYLHKRNGQQSENTKYTSHQAVGLD